MPADTPRQLELVFDESSVSAVHGSLAAGNRHPSISSLGLLHGPVPHTTTPVTTSTATAVVIQCHAMSQ